MKLTYLLVPLAVVSCTTTSTWAADPTETVGGHEGFSTNMTANVYYGNATNEKEYTEHKFGTLMDYSRPAVSMFQEELRKNAEIVQRVNDVTIDENDEVGKKIKNHVLSSLEANRKELNEALGVATNYVNSKVVQVGNKWTILTGDGRRLSLRDADIKNTLVIGIKNHSNDIQKESAKELKSLAEYGDLTTYERIEESLAADKKASGGYMLALAGQGKTTASSEGIVDRTVTNTKYKTNVINLGSGDVSSDDSATSGTADASVVAIGHGTQASVKAGESAILIGDNSKTEGNGIAIGKNATSGKDSVALGNNSVATGANELSIGNEKQQRKITNMADGTNDSDGATIHNVKSEIASLDSKAQNYADNAKDTAITEANKYTDGVVLKANETVLNSANDYTDKAKDDAIKRAKKYTDEATLKANDKVLDEAKGYTDTAKKEAVTDANKYSDDTAENTLKSANDYTERRAVVAENNAVTRSNAYTDESSSRTLESANTYTNHRSVQAENNAVARSNAYTDNRFGELRKSLQHTEKRLNAGIAGVTAISSIPYAAGNKFSYGLGAGNYQNGNAIAAGVQFRVSQSANVRFNVSWDSAGNNAIGAGFSGGW
ncbi:YadA-like family protein [Salmonella enterica]|nr:YadA-like family protein [Salmonella enterica]